MSTLIEINNQIKELEAKAKEIRAIEMIPAVQKIKETMALYGITVNDLRETPESKSDKTGSAKNPTKTKAATKYRDENGNTWSGRGLKPKWMTAALATGRSLEDFFVTTPTTAK